MTHRTVTNVLGKSMAITSPIAIPNSANPTTRFIFFDPSLIMYLLQLEPEHLMRTRRKKEPEVLAAR